MHMVRIDYRIDGGEWLTRIYKSRAATYWRANKEAVRHIDRYVTKLGWRKEWEARYSRIED